MICSKDVQIPGARSPWRLKFVDPQNATFFTSPFWRLQF